MRCEQMKEDHQWIPDHLEQIHRDHEVALHQGWREGADALRRALGDQMEQDCRMRAPVSATDWYQGTDGVSYQNTWRTHYTGKCSAKGGPVANDGWGNPDASTGSWGDACNGCDAWGHTFEECPAREAHSDLHTIAGLVFREHMAQAADCLHKAAAVAKAALQQWDAEVQIYRALI